MTRRAYIGISGPLAYDYKNQGDKFDSRESSAPNPLLEDSLGLLICYDELVFLSPHLCPRNMRELPYISYLNDRVDFSEVFPVALEQADSLYAVPERTRQGVCKSMGSICTCPMQHNWPAITGTSRRSNISPR